MSRIIDIPLCPVELPDEKRCVHLLMTGERCTREATYNQLCEIHYQWFASSLGTMGIQFPEDSISLQVMLMKAMELVVTNRIDFKRTKPLVEICKLMAHNVRWYQDEIRDTERRTQLKALKPADR